MTYKVKNKVNIIWGFVIIVLSVTADQLSKIYITNTFEPYQKNLVKIIENFMYISHVRNKGAGWSILQGQTFILVGVTGIVLTLMFLFMFYTDRMMLTVSVAMIVGGGLGNLIDRIFRPAGVVDFIDVYIFGYDFPVFNAADSILVCGTILFTVYLLFFFKDENMGFRLPRLRKKELSDMDEMNLYYNEDKKSERLDLWLLGEMPECTRSFIQKLIENGDILVNGKPAKSRDKLIKGDEVLIKIPEPVLLEAVPQNIPLDIIYEDNDIIVINKPKNMVVHPAAGNPDGTVVNALLYHCRDGLSDINGVIRPGIVHRIDKNTTGLLCIAKNNTAHLHLTEQLKNHSMKRTYIALVEKVINEDNGTIDAPIGRHPADRKKMAVNIKSGREAVTHFKVLERFSKYTLVEVSLETGRTHQIRVHMAYIGHPVCGDEAYGRKFPLCETNGQILHAYKLELNHPSELKNQVFLTEIPEYINKILNELRI